MQWGPCSGLSKIDTMSQSPWGIGPKSSMYWQAGLLIPCSQPAYPWATTMPLLASAPSAWCQAQRIRQNPTLRLGCLNGAARSVTPGGVDPPAWKRLMMPCPSEEVADEGRVVPPTGIPHL